MAKLSNQKCRSAGFLKIPCCAGLFLSLLEHMKATFGLKELESVRYQFFCWSGYPCTALDQLWNPAGNLHDVAFGPPQAVSTSHGPDRVLNQLSVLGTRVSTSCTHVLKTLRLKAARPEITQIQLLESKWQKAFLGACKMHVCGRLGQCTAQSFLRAVGTIAMSIPSTPAKQCSRPSGNMKMHFVGPAKCIFAGTSNVMWARD